jgi:hypothetical protein
MSTLNNFFEKRKEENLKRMGYENNLNMIKKANEEEPKEIKKDNVIFKFFKKISKNN